MRHKFTVVDAHAQKRRHRAQGWTNMLRKYATGPRGGRTCLERNTTRPGEDANTQKRRHRVRGWTHMFRKDDNTRKRSQRVQRRYNERRIRGTQSSIILLNIFIVINIKYFQILLNCKVSNLHRNIKYTFFFNYFVPQIKIVNCLSCTQ